MVQSATDKCVQFVAGRPYIPWVLVVSPSSCDAWKETEHADAGVFTVLVAVR